MQSNLPIANQPRKGIVAACAPGMNAKGRSDFHAAQAKCMTLECSIFANWCIVRRIGATHLMRAQEDSEIQGFMGLSRGLPKALTAFRMTYRFSDVRCWSRGKCTGDLNLHIAWENLSHFAGSFKFNLLTQHLDSCFGFCATGKTVARDLALKAAATARWSSLAARARSTPSGTYESSSAGVARI